MRRKKLLERWDENGYPQGLKGDEIPLLARKPLLKY